MFVTNRPDIQGKRCYQPSIWVSWGSSIVYKGQVGQGENKPSPIPNDDGGISPSHKAEMGKILIIHRAAPGNLLDISWQSLGESLIAHSLFFSSLSHSVPGKRYEYGTAPVTLCHKKSGGGYNSVCLLSALKYKSRSCRSPAQYYTQHGLFRFVSWQFFESS